MPSSRGLVLQGEMALFYSEMDPEAFPAAPSHSVITLHIAFFPTCDELQLSVLSFRTWLTADMC